MLVVAMKVTLLALRMGEGRSLVELGISLGTSTALVSKPVAGGKW